MDNLENGTQDDFVQDPPENEPENQPEPEYLVAYGEGADEVKLTGDQVIERLSKASEFENLVKSLREENEKLKSQPAQVQPQLVPQTQTKEAGPDINQQAIQLLESFANGDMTTIPQIVALIAQSAREAARAEATQGFTNFSREQAFTAKYGDAGKLFDGNGNIVDPTFRDYAAQNKHLYTDGVQLYLAFAGEQKAAAMQKEIDSLKAQVLAATTKGENKGEQKTLTQIKARGGFRVLQGNARQSAAAQTKVQTSEDDPYGMKAGLMKIRGVSELI